nr:hypothetical protein [Tanacetum cinerariifolium]
MFIDEQVKSESMDVVSNISSSAVKTVESKIKSIDVKNKGVYSTIETKPVRNNNFSPPIIEDWNSHDERNKVYAVKASGWEDRLKLKELMELSTKLSDRVLDLEKIKTTQAKEIVDLKKRVKKLERKRSGEDRLKLKELMELSTKLSDRVLDLEKIKTTQAKEIVDLKKRVKKLERKRRTSWMNLFKIGTSRRRSLGEEDASKHERNLKQSSIFKENDFDVKAMMDADYELAVRLRAEEQRRKPLTKAQKRNQI